MVIMLILPSLKYWIEHKTVLGFDTYFDFTFETEGENKSFIEKLLERNNKEINDEKFYPTLAYIAIFSIISIIYLIILKRKRIFNNIKKLLLYIGIIGSIFTIMLPWTSSDIFFYMGLGEINSIYKQNPYYVTIKEYFEKNPDIKNDDIMAQANSNVWAKTTAVYGPLEQLILSAITFISLKNINLCLFLFKIINVILHMLNCYLIYKITKKLKWAIVYGMNPFIFFEFIGNVHNDIILVFFVLLGIYFLLKKKKLIPTIICLAFATGIKYFTVLLLPIAILYHYRNEKKITKKILQCFKYGMLFLLIVALEYIIYAKDLSIITAMMVQTERYYRSIYSGYFLTHRLVFLVPKVRDLLMLTTIILYFIICIQMLVNKNNRFYKMVRD